MSGAAPLSHPIAAPAAEPETSARALIERQLAMLTELAEIGTEIARAAGRRASAQAEADGAGAGAADPGLSYARAARAVRLTIALQSRLLQERAALGRAEAVARVAEATRRRNRIHARVDAAIEAERDNDFEVEQLSVEARERLNEVEEEDLLGRPIEAVVARICADLGLSPAWAGSAFARPGGEIAGPAAPDGVDGAPFAGPRFGGPRFADPQFAGPQFAGPAEFAWPDPAPISAGASPERPCARSRGSPAGAGPTARPSRSAGDHAPARPSTMAADEAAPRRFMATDAA